MVVSWQYQAKAISILQPIETTGDHPVLSTAGNLATYAVPLAALAATLVLRDWQGVGQFLVAFAISSGATGILKNVVNECRPRQPACEIGNSFPSGHATAAFAGSWFIWRRFGWRHGLFASLFAVFVGYYRVEVNAHWVHDVVASAFIAFLAAYLFVSKRANPKLNPMIKFGFSPKEKLYGIRLYFNKEN
jgi:membrane-associated phospholipid phosphatase